MPRLRIQHKESWYDVQVEGEVFVIGRSNECDHVIDSGFISRKHCQFERTPDGWQIRDFGSSLGTAVNGSVIQLSPVHFGDTVIFADRIEALFLADNMANTETMRVVQPDYHRGGEQLTVLDGPTAGKHYSLNTDIISIGRGQENDIVIPMDTVSSNHAELTKEEEGWVLRDLASGNGTYVNGERIGHQVLQNGDVLRLDCVSLRYEESHFKVDKQGTRVRGELLKDTQPATELIERPQVAVSQMQIVHDMPIERPSKRLKNMKAQKKKGGVGVLLFSILLALLLLGAVGFGLWWVYENYFPDGIPGL